MKSMILTFKDFSSTEKLDRFIEFGVYSVHYKGRCLYVGSTNIDVYRRFFGRQGHCPKTCFGLSARSKVGQFIVENQDNIVISLYEDSPYNTIEQTRIAEKKAIKELSPEFNIHWN